MSVAQQQPQPGSQPEKRSRPKRRGIWRLLVWLVVLGLIGGGTYGGYRLGQEIRPVEIWDPVWLRAKLGRPLDHTVARPGLKIAGYYVDYDQDSYLTLRDRSPWLDYVISFSYAITAEGDVVGRDPQELLGISPPAKRILLFSNIDQAAGGFSGAIARSVLTQPAVQEKAIAGIIAKLEALDAAGMELDFEDIAPDLRPQLSAFVAKLTAAVHETGRTVSMAVPAKLSDDPENSWSGAFDYAALGSTVDSLMLMAYDEHYRLGDPGPVASLAWTENVIRYAMTVMPTQKIVLGVPLYGYDWKAPGEGEAFGLHSVAARVNMPGAKVEWVEEVGENKLTYTASDGSQHVAWYPDQRSLAAKRKLAEFYRLQGIALWRLGFETPEEWSVLPDQRAP
jgi:spore germination protein